MVLGGCWSVFPYLPSVISFAAPEQEQEKWRPYQCSEDPHRQHSGCNDNTRQEIGKRKKDGSAKSRGRQKQAVARSQQKAHGMGCHQSYKTNQTTNGDGGRCQPSINNDNDEFAPFTMQTQLRRPL